MPSGSVTVNCGLALALVKSAGSGNSRLQGSKVKSAQAFSVMHVSCGVQCEVLYAQHVIMESTVDLSEHSGNYSLHGQCTHAGLLGGSK